MQRLCERPGCSDPASVAYGMRAEDLVFWLDVLRGEGDPETDLDPGGRGVLCRRHADSMVVPRDWTLDDLRDPDLHLFRPPAADASAGRRAPRRSGARDRSVDQLTLGVEATPDTETNPVADTVPPVDPLPRVDPDPPVDPVPTADSSPDADADSSSTGTDTESAPETETETETGAGQPWTPSFDDGDDLDGLLAAQSPLLARAFRGADRTKGS